MPTNPQPDRYRQRPNECDAIQWTGHNADALRAFAGIDFATIDPADRVEDLDCDAQLLVEASHWVGIKPGDWVLKFEGYFIAKDDVPFRAVWEPASTAPLAVDLPARLVAALTERFTELGNPFSAMHRQEKGPDGWPASHPVGPHHVAEVLRELLTAAPAVVPSAPADRAAILRGTADAYDALIAKAPDKEADPRYWQGVRDVAIGLRALAGEAQQPETPPAATEAPAVCEGFQWIGQSFATCDRCGQPAWDHAGEEVAVDGAGPFDTRRTVRPWKPGQADAMRAKWAPSAAVSQPSKEA